MRASEKRFFLILLFSILLHVCIFVAFSVSSRVRVNENRVEIDLNNIEIPQEQPVINPVEPEEMTQINPREVVVPRERIRVENVKPVRRIFKEKRIDYSRFATIERDIPMNYPTPRSVASPHPVVKKAKATAKPDPKLLSLYLRRVRALIESNKIYPMSAREKGIEGKVLISFVVLRDGSVKELKILKSSGSSSLDRAARKAIIDSVPFPAFPPELKKSSLKLKLYIVFKLEGEEEW